MALSQRLDIRQSQSLVMTPQLQQAIKLLALSSLEIQAFVDDAVEKNPLLEIAQADGADRRDTDNNNAAEDAAPLPTSQSGERSSDDILNSSDMAASEAMDADYAVEAFDHDTAGDSVQSTGISAGGADGMLGLSAGGSGGGDDFDAPDFAGPDFDSFAAPELTLREHLLAQAGASLSGTQLFLVQQLIDLIEPAGYLGANLLSAAHRLGVPLPEMEAALICLQSYDPTGVGARDLAECIALQAKEADRYDPCMAKLIDNLDLVARGNFDGLRRICRVDEEDLRDMLIELRSYDPKPGSHFGEEHAQAVTPDIFLSADGNSWSLELNSANLPRLLVNNNYTAQLGIDGTDKATKEWLNDCLADANWLIRAMDQRQRTILKVTAEIVKQQDGFFRGGIAHLRPLTLRQVADAIEMHESTVSRVTSNKYLYCGRGLFDLKYFFSSGIASADGEGASAAAVKSHIKTMIAAEGTAGCAKILSDDTLVVMLKAQGFDLARRTVAKYREAIGIGSSVQRRRQKKMGS